VQVYAIYGVYLVLVSRVAYSRTHNEDNLRDHILNFNKIREREAALLTGASPGRKQCGGQKARVGLMASAERHRQRGPGKEPLVRGSGGFAP